LKTGTSENLTLQELSEMQVTRYVDRNTIQDRPTFQCEISFALGASSV
jgi:hypothetical protein